MRSTTAWFASFLVFSCGGSGEPADAGSGENPPPLAATGGGGGLDVDDLPLGGGSGVPSGPTLLTELPPGFTAAEGVEDGDEGEPRGGYRWVGPLASTDPVTNESCANVLRVLVRDFEIFEHPDFGGGRDPDDAVGMVEAELDADRKPVRTDVYPEVAGRFEDWYANVEGTNVPHLVELWLEPVGGAFVFDSSRFFPLDEVESDEERREDGDDELRNFGFTTELHTSFEYRGGEEFTFRGDDDVFVFVDGKLVVDLGGVHSAVEGSVALDELGLTVGEVYDLDLFQAERNPSGSNFRIETSLDFTECGEILPGDVVR